MKVRDVLSILAFGAIIAFAVSYIGALGVRVRPPEDRINIAMDVVDINNLVVGSNVLLRGVPVGKVTTIEAGTQAATVHFYIDNRFRVPVNSDVRLDNLSALGEAYIGLVPRTKAGPMMYEGQHLTTERVTQPPSISELATSVVRVLNQLDPGALKRVINEADIALPDPNTTLPNMARASMLLRNNAADMNGTGRALLDNFQTLLRNATWVGPVLRDLPPDVRSIGKSTQIVWHSTIRMRYNGGPQFEVELKNLMARIQRLLDNNAGDIKVIGEALKPHMQGIAGALANIDSAQLLSNFLQGIPEDGTITLHVQVPPP